MSMRDIERAIVAEAAVLLNNRKLRLKDLMEWRNAPITNPREDEIVLEVPASGVNWSACFQKSCDKRVQP